MVAYDHVQGRATPKPFKFFTVVRSASDSYSRLRWLTLRVSFSNPAVAFDRGAFTVREHRKQIAALVGLAPYDFQESRPPASPAAERAPRAAMRLRRHRGVS
jgi:hypothetical protein